MSDFTDFGVKNDKIPTPKHHIKHHVFVSKICDTKKCHKFQSSMFSIELQPNRQPCLRKKWHFLYHKSNVILKKWTF